MLLESLAKELVRVTSELVGGRTINIMNTEGYIIASTEPERIGTFHQGALEAVRTGKAVNIQRSELANYPGAKEGCNMPLRVCGTVIGVVGMYGDPAEIQYLAHLLEVYAAMYYQLEAMASPKLSSTELRSRILSDLLFPKENSQADACYLMRAQGIHLTPPLVVAVLSKSTGAPLSLPQDQRMLSKLEEYLQPQQDLSGIISDRLVLVLSHRKTPLSQKLRQEAPELLESYRISFSAPWGDLTDIPKAYAQATALDDSAPEAMNDMAELPTRCHYMLSCVASSDEAFLEKLRSQALEAFSPREYLLLLETARCYYDKNRSVSQAAEAMFIHKNTLQYRMRRLLQALSLSRHTDFQQEFVVRLLLEYETRKQGRWALK